MDQILKNFWSKLNGDIGELWKNNKVFLIVFGVLILVVKFREVIINILVSSARRAMENAKEQDAVLKGNQDSANNAANQLRDDAVKLGENKPPVDENWNKND